MKRIFFVLILLCIANGASAYEYRLQFTPPAYGRILTIVGYKFSGKDVVGKCSYSVTPPCSGRGCHSTTTYYYDTCTWDLYGNLLGVVSGAPPAQTPLYTSGTEVVYATSNIANTCVPGEVSTTGIDTRNFGFVATPTPHYTWQTTNGSYAVIPDAVYSVPATLLSDGDCSLAFTGAKVVTQIFGTYTTSAGSASISHNTCVNVAPGSQCTVTVSYNPTTISCTGSPYGYAYTGIDLSPGSDAPIRPDFTERFTVTGVPICDD